MNAFLNKVCLTVLMGLYGISLQAQVPVKYSGNQEKELQVYYSKAPAYMFFGMGSVLGAMSIASYVMPRNDNYSCSFTCGVGAALLCVAGAVFCSAFYHTDMTKPFLIINQDGITTENEGLMLWGDIIEVFADSKVVDSVTTKDVLHITLSDGAVVDINLMWAHKSSEDCLKFMRTLWKKMRHQ